MKKKAIPAKRKPRIYFEQVPVKVLKKKIIGGDSKTSKLPLANVIVAVYDQFADLKYLSEKEASAAEIKGDYPESEPLLMQ